MKLRCYNNIAHLVNKYTEQTYFHIQMSVITYYPTQLCKFFSLIYSSLLSYNVKKHKNTTESKFQLISTKNKILSDSNSMKSSSSR